MHIYRELQIARGYGGAGGRRLECEHWYRCVAATCHWCAGPPSPPPHNTLLTSIAVVLLSRLAWAATCSRWARLLRAWLLGLDTAYLQATPGRAASCCLSGLGEARSCCRPREHRIPRVQRVPVNC